MQQAQAELLEKTEARQSLIRKWYIGLPCSLLVGPEEDFHILVDVLHLFESFKEFLRNQSTHKIIQSVNFE